MLIRIITPDKNLQLIQDNVDRAIIPLQNLPMVGGNVLDGVALITGQDNLVAHKLGHSVRFWIVVNQNADTTVWTADSVSLSNQSTNSQFINLKCSANCTVSVWVN